MTEISSLSAVLSEFGAVRAKQHAVERMDSGEHIEHPNGSVETPGSPVTETRVDRLEPKGGTYQQLVFLDGFFCTQNEVKLCNYAIIINP